MPLSNNTRDSLTRLVDAWETEGFFAPEVEQELLLVSASKLRGALGEPTTLYPVLWSLIKSCPLRPLTALPLLHRAEAEVAAEHHARLRAREVKAEEERRAIVDRWKTDFRGGLSGSIPPPAEAGTYFVLWEPGIVKIGRSSCISKRLRDFTGSCNYSTQLLAWTTDPEKELHERFARSWYDRECFRLTGEVLEAIDGYRMEKGWWPVDLPAVEGMRSTKTATVISPEWEARLAPLPYFVQDAFVRLLKTRTFQPRSHFRRGCRDRLVGWLDGPGGPLPFGEHELNRLLGPIHWARVRPAWQQYLSRSRRTA